VNQDDPLHPKLPQIASMVGRAGKCSDRKTPLGLSPLKTLRIGLSAKPNAKNETVALVPTPEYDDG